MDGAGIGYTVSNLQGGGRSLYSMIRYDCQFIKKALLYSFLHTYLWIQRDSTSQKSKSPK